MKKTIFVFIIIMTLVASLIGQTSVEKKKEVKDVFDLLSPEKKDKLIQMFVTDYPFKNSNQSKAVAAITLKVVLRQKNNAHGLYVVEYRESEIKE